MYTKKTNKSTREKSPRYLKDVENLQGIIETSERLTAAISSKSMVIPQRQKNRLIKNHTKRIFHAKELIKLIQFQDD